MDKAYKNRATKLRKLIKGKEEELLKALRSGDTALANALLHMGNEPEMQELLEKEKKDELEWKEHTGEGKLFEAIERGDIDIIAALIESGVSINTRHPKSGMTPLMLVISMFRDLGCVKCFHNNGADINISSNNNITALDIAVVLECADIVNYLRENGGKSGKWRKKKLN